MEKLKEENFRYCWEAIKETDKLKTENRIMKKALLEITSFRYWHISADFSPKKIAEKALLQINHLE